MVRVLLVMNRAKNGLKCAVADVFRLLQHLCTTVCALESARNIVVPQPRKNGLITDGIQAQQEIDHKVEYSGVSNSPINKRQNLD